MRVFDLLHSAEIKVEGAIDKTSEILISDIKKAMIFLENKTPEVINALSIVSKITTEFIKASQSPQGLIVEAIIEKYIPASSGIYAVVIPLAKKMSDSINKVINDLPSIEAIALRYGAEIISKIDGDKKSIDQYILDFQSTFI